VRRETASACIPKIRPKTWRSSGDCMVVDCGSP
jgi:hypothetical protein